MYGQDIAAGMLPSIVVHDGTSDVQGFSDTSRSDGSKASLSFHRFRKARIYKNKIKKAA